MSTENRRPRPIDILEYMKDECQLNEWEKQFVPSVIKWLRDGEGRRPSVKQAAIIDKMYVKFDLADDADRGYLVYGYADRTDQEVISPPVQTRPATSFDDLDDDIPF